VSRKAVAALAVFCLASCGHGSPKAGSSPQDVVQTDHEVRSGHLVIRALAGRCGIHEISGTHAFLEPTGQFCRLRVRASDGDTSAHAFATGAQRLILTDGTAIAPSSGGMAVKRQPEAVALGAEDSVELVLWFDIPTSSRVSGVRLVGDQDTDAAGAFVRPSVHPEGVVVPLHGLTS
jgi:hypothetical protein